MTPSWRTRDRTVAAASAGQVGQPGRVGDARRWCPRRPGGPGPGGAGQLGQGLGRRRRREGSGGGSSSGSSSGGASGAGRGPGSRSMSMNWTDMRTPALAVGDGVVELLDHGAPAVGQPVDQDELPQRVVAVERGRGHLGGQVEELALDPGESRVTWRTWRSRSTSALVDPLRGAQPGPGLLDPLAEPGHGDQGVGHPGPEPVQVRGVVEEGDVGEGRGQVGVGVEGPHERLDVAQAPVGHDRGRPSPTASSPSPEGPRTGLPVSGRQGGVLELVEGREPRRGGRGPARSVARARSPSSLGAVHQPDEGGLVAVDEGGHAPHVVVGGGLARARPAPWPAAMPSSTAAKASARVEAVVDQHLADHVAVAQVEAVVVAGGEQRPVDGEERLRRRVAHVDARPGGRAGRCRRPGRSQIGASPSSTWTWPSEKATKVTSHAGPVGQRRPARARGRCGRRGSGSPR